YTCPGAGVNVQDCVWRFVRWAVSAATAIPAVAVLAYHGAPMRHEHILSLSCPDRTGIVYRVSGLLFGQGCNILDAQQYGDEERGRFFLRVHFTLPAADALPALLDRFDNLATEFEMDWQIHDAQRRARLLVLVSRQGH